VKVVDRADQCFSYCSILKKTEMVKESDTVSDQLCSVWCILCPCKFECRRQI